MTKQQIKEALDAIKEHCARYDGGCYQSCPLWDDCPFLSNMLPQWWDTEKIAEVIADETD